MNWLEALPFLNLAGFLVLGGGLFYTQWKTGSNGGIHVATEVLDLYKVQIAQLREELAAEKKGRVDDNHALKNQIQLLQLQLENMKGADTEKDKKLDELTAIFQNRDPQQTEIMNKIVSIMEETRMYLKSINLQGTINAARNDQIDSTTAEGTGKVMKSDPSGGGVNLSNITWLLPTLSIIKNIINNWKVVIPITQDQENRQKSLEDNASRTPAEENEFNALNALDEAGEDLADAQAALATAVANEAPPTPDPLAAEKQAVVDAQARVDAANTALTAAQTA